MFCEQLRKNFTNREGFAESGAGHGICGFEGCGVSDFLRRKMTPVSLTLVSFIANGFKISQLRELRGEIANPNFCDGQSVFPPGV
jgi:hypothetical protein